MFNLDFFQAPAHKFGPVFAVPASFCAQWRVRNGLAPLLREDPESPPERLLRRCGFTSACSAIT